MPHRTRPIRVGLIGYGLGGRAFHAPYIAGRDDMALVAVVSGDPAKVHRDHPSVAVDGSVEALLLRSDLDLVVVASPDHLHAEHVLAALGAGKHVVVDKPFATSLRDARRMVEAAHTAGKLLVPFQNRRWDADFLTLRHLIGSGQLGEIVHFQSRFDRWRPLDATVWKEARAGGSWQDLGPHLIDQAIVLFGMPDAVTADIQALRPGAPAPDWFEVILHYPAMRATLHSSKVAADHRLRFAVHGSGGSWIKHGLDPQEQAVLAGQLPGSPDWGIDPIEGEFTPAGAPAARQAVHNARGDYGLFWTQVAQALTDGAPPPVSTDQALATMTILEAGLQSAAERRTVNLPVPNNP